MPRKEAPKIPETPPAKAGKRGRRKSAELIAQWEAIFRERVGKRVLLMRKGIARLNSLSRRPWIRNVPNAVEAWNSIVNGMISELEQCEIVATQAQTTEQAFNIFDYAKQSAKGQ